MDDIAGKPRRSLITRRGLLVAGGIGGGTALVVGVAAANLTNIISIGAEKPDLSAFGPFVRITPDGWVTVVNKHQEMGQGAHVALAAMVAEELDADWDKVRVEAAPANTAVYKNLSMGMQATGGSTATANAWDQFRRAGAAARAMMVAAAAGTWQVAASEIKVKNGVVSHPGSGRTAPFAQLLDAAAKIAPPQSPQLKSPDQFTLIGTDRVRRKDSLAKSTGQERYTQDVLLPDMLTAMVAHPPQFGARVESFDGAAARLVAGVVDVFEIPSGIAVVASHTYAAKKGRDALKVTWNTDKAEKRSTGELLAWYREIATGKGKLKPETIHKSGKPDKAFSGEVFETSFDLPYLAHAAMEPMNCVAQVDGTRVKLTFASQIQTVDQVNTAIAVGTLPGMVEIETLSAGGSFGRRGSLTSDYTVECVHIAKKIGGNRPVKLVWTREDDMSAGCYRPLSHYQVSVKTDADGYPQAWRHIGVAQALMPVGKNTAAVEGLGKVPYVAMATDVDIQVYSPRFPVPVSFWRSVGATQTIMVTEHVIDQLARRAGRDPADYRREIYRRMGDSRRLAVLDLACQKAGWGKPLEAGWARGLAVGESFGTVVAQVAEVRLVDGRPVVRRVVGAVDCGLAVAPDQIAAQMEGGTAFGLSAALYSQILLRDGQVSNTNFDSYPILRINEMPIVETHILPSTNKPSGMGEPGTPVIAPAVANAILALTGRATRSLPFIDAEVVS
ncbi:xanthine dehydrogenase family protein molybdopterin-binding subunit [Asticcacaulis sp. AC402]|uniref:xanthine dehydrogenase family protein molybdopterin-binding subunit n=1 Tax=Asticcacaulis sp. AC402 TaxID=1282361 RepID=UPI0003C3E695|nr:xanthine dehydrogenase family protein molybdopterin-binding subunit [Asticcacaulis sp. AC402]ESQ76092.1 hypothetical protein ABAC402_06495 [Asticcacaulis sp. AC402]